jgi:DNA-binding IclR family transcriptional regulator
MNSMGTTQDKILETLKDNSKGLTAREIAREMKYPYNRLPTMLMRMKNFSLIDFIFKDNEKIWKLNYKGENVGEKKKSL